MSAPAPEHLVGHRLPEGTFTITEEENRRVSEALATGAGQDGLAHPVFAYVATQRGIGIDIDEVFRLAECSMEDGPLLGSTEIEFATPLRLGVTYRVLGTIVEILRKRGSRMGSFDVLTVQEEMVDASGKPAVVVRNQFILPRSHGI